MDVKDLKRLLEAVKEADIGELVLETGDYKLTVKRGAEVVQVAQPAPQPVQTAQSAPAPQSAPPSEPAQSAPAQADPAPTPAQPEAEAPSNLSEVTAPIVGTFYASPSPDAPDYVKVGDKVEAGAVLCIIEAMKLMNEIEADTAGTVREVLVENTEPVEYGQVLFRIEPR